MFRITLTDRRGPLRFRRYEHERRGVVETLTLDTVVYVRPCFGLLVDEPKLSKPPKCKAKRRPLGGMWKRAAGGRS